MIQGGTTHGRTDPVHPAGCPCKGICNYFTNNVWINYFLSHLYKLFVKLFSVDLFVEKGKSKQSEQNLRP